MGLPLGPKFPEISMCSDDTFRLPDCPAFFKPRVYKINVEDVFSMFRLRTEFFMFVTLIIDKHPNTYFGIEHETDRLNFIGCSVS